MINSKSRVLRRGRIRYFYNTKGFYIKIGDDEVKIGDGEVS